MTKKEAAATPFRSGPGKDASNVHVFGNIEAISPHTDGMSILHLAGGSTVAVVGTPDELAAGLAD